MPEPTALNLAETLIYEQDEERFQQDMAQKNRILLPLSLALAGGGALMIAELPTVPAKVLGAATLVVGLLIGKGAVDEIHEADREAERARKKADHLRTSLEKINGNQPL